MGVSRTAGVGRRAVGLCVQHAAAWLRERVLRPRLPHFACAFLGPADHRRGNAQAALPGICPPRHSR